MFFLFSLVPPALPIEQQSAIVSQAIYFASSKQMKSWESLLESVHNRKLKFEIKWVSIRKKDGGYYKQSDPIDRPLDPPLLPLDVLEVSGFFNFDHELRIFILNSPSIYWLSNTNDPEILDSLVQLLDVPDRAWAANVTLAKMLGSTGLSFEIREGKAEQWWETEGKTGKAKQEWAAYLEKVKPTLKWSILGGYYKHITPEGKKVP
jgi:hypothetical protein